jgi:uncharacterized membrane protein YjgN (DUF898 family)
MTGFMVAAGILVAIILAALPKQDGAAPHYWVTFLPLVFALVLAYFAYLLMGPYTQARLGNLVWSNTAFPGIEIRSTMSARAFARLQTVNVLLTLLTLGLYRPFAVVKIYRFRLANLSLHGAAGLAPVVATVARQRRGATGDGVADFFDLDLSW